MDITRAIAHGHYDASKSHICPTGRTSMHMRAECAAPLTATPPQPPASSRGSPWGGSSRTAARSRRDRAAHAAPPGTSPAQTTTTLRGQVLSCRAGALRPGGSESPALCRRSTSSMEASPRCSLPMMMSRLAQGQGPRARQVSMGARSWAERGRGAVLTLPKVNPAEYLVGRGLQRAPHCEFGNFSFANMIAVHT